MGIMCWAEHQGLSRNLIGPIFLFSTVMIYAFIGVAGRTSNADEYYVAGRRIPAFYNGMATAADWMSAASFISLAGALYLQGYSGSGDQAGGLAYVMGWTGGFCLVALLIAPHLRSMNLYTLPDFFSQRFGGRWPSWNVWIFIPRCDSVIGRSIATTIAKGNRAWLHSLAVLRRLDLQRRGFCTRLQLLLGKFIGNEHSSQKWKHRRS